MNKKKLTKVAQRLSLMLVAAVLLFCAVWSPQAEAVSYQASYIERNDSVRVDYTDYLNSDVVQKLPDTVSDDDMISVIITVDEVSIMDAYVNTDKQMSFTDYALFSQEAQRIEANVLAARDAYLAQLDAQDVAYTVSGITYSVLMTGFELYITARDFDAVCSELDKGMDIMVSEAYQVAESTAVSNTVNVHSTGIINTDGIGFDGSGLVVAVLDTGLDYAHSAFDESRFTSTNLGLTYEQVAAVLDQTMASQQYEGLSVDDVFISNKVPFGFDYADQNPDVYSTHNNHGTHVSGIIVGNDDTIRGVAPNAQLVSMKVFSDVYDSALASWILSALEDCVVLGVDVINMSLGTAAGFSREGDEEKLWGVYDKIRAAGITLMVAASNSYSSAYGSEANGNLGLTSNPDTATVGSPGTYNGAMSVASISGTLTPYLLIGETIVYFDEANSGAGKELSFCENLLGGESSKTLDYVVIPGVGRSADYSGMDVAGKIVLVSRGDNTFEEKALIAQKQGAAGIIIYNNVSGDIKMNVGNATLAVCSISKDNGKFLVDNAGESGIGQLVIGTAQAAGPFISDFSSWGPTPDLGIKPEITGEGGNILSAVTGGGYDRLSGTSMATPNLAGVALLMRQYIISEFPQLANDPVAVNSMLYRLMMSTADIVYNENGLPYAVRKQGAGLCNLRDALASTAVITTYGKDGKAMDKTKLELGDDPEKIGVYTMKFTVENFGASSLSYDIGSWVLTEGVSETLTNAGLTTVTEQGYVLSGAALTIDSVNGGTLDGVNLTVDAGKKATVTVTLTLSDADKTYLDTSFENGMYVEGFITLTPTAGTEVDMSVPFLAFYGNWNEAPIFDKDYFETNKDELDQGIDEEDKVKADAYATRAIGGIQEDFVSYLGGYYFEQNPADRVISASRDYVALSNQDGTIHSLRFVWAGLLRGCSKIVVTITDDTTGEVIFETVDYDVRKSYGDGGSIYPANIEIEFDTMDYNLMNNSEYTVKLVGYTDYGDGGIEDNDKNVFEFPLVVDFEAPTVSNVAFRYEYDKTLKKNRLYADISVYDNHHAMALQVGYVGTMDEDGDGVVDNYEIKTFSQYMTPVYSQKNSTTVVSYELTDYIYLIKSGAVNPNSFVVTTYDYALNYATYEIGLPDNYVDFYMAGLENNTITLSPNEIYSLTPAVYPTTEWAELLEFTSSKNSVVRVVNDKLVAVSSGTATVKVRDPETNKSVTFKVKVLAEGDEGYMRYDKPVADVFTMTGFYTINAHYLINSTDRELGATGDTRFFDDGQMLTMYPAESVLLLYNLAAYFPEDLSITFTSGNPNVVMVDSSGVVTAVGEGNANIAISLVWKETGKSTNYTANVKVSVKDPFVANGATLSAYYGNGGVVTIPNDMSLTRIGAFAFSNFDYTLKTEEELAIDDSSLSKQTPLGNNTITKVIIPEGVEAIDAYAFANLTALQEVVLPSTMKYIEYGAFSGCGNLKKLTFSGENNIVTINQFAFEGCNLTGTLDLPSAYVISDRAFAGNTALKVVNLPETLMTIGASAFAGCSGLEQVNISADKVKFGEYAFTGCTSLVSFKLNTSVIPVGMFYGCTALNDVTIGKEVGAIYEYAFRDTDVKEFTVEEGNPVFQAHSGGILVSADGKTLVAVAPGYEGKTFTGDSAITTIARGAFSHNSRLETVTVPNATVVGPYAFAVERPEYDDYGNLASVKPGKLKNIQLGKLISIGEYGFCGVALTALPEIAADATIGKYAFCYSGLEQVQIPDGMILSEGMFADCASLTTVIIGDNVTIGANAFGTNKDYIYSVKYYQENDRYYYYYEFATALKSVTIGENAIIGENAFVNAASLESVTLGANAQIGKMAFYNNSALRSIDLSKAVSIGEYAFSGDVYYICADGYMTVAAISPAGTYMYSYHAPKLVSIDLAAAQSIGAYAFAYCTELQDVKLNAAVTELPEYAFANCFALTNINLEKVANIGDYAFMECGLAKADLSKAETVGAYAFANCANLAELTLNAAGTVVGEGAFGECASLTYVGNLEWVPEIGAYAFANTGIVEADLSAAQIIGDFAFMKREVTDFEVYLGNALVSLGDNPFAMCRVEPFFQLQTENFNGLDYHTFLFTYDISETVKVIDGSLYCVVPNGLELITYTGANAENVQVAENTVRVTAYAFAGSGVKMVTLPYTVAAIGHKAFYRCDELKIVAFTSYNAPILEEELDTAYYDSLLHVPGTGEYEYYDYDGNLVYVDGMQIVPYFMWNATGGMYSNAFYGANFIDYVGAVENKVLMVRPSNGQGYDSFVLGKYFDLEMTMDGATAADDNTLAFIAAVGQLPERISYSHKAQVEAARALYNKITGLDQQSLAASAYANLLTAEQRIKALTPADETTQAFIDAINALPETVTLAEEDAIAAARELYEKITDEAQRQKAADAYEKLVSLEEQLKALNLEAAQKSGTLIATVIIALVVIGGVIVAIRNLPKRKKEPRAEAKQAEPEQSAAPAEETPAQPEPTEDTQA